MKKNFLLVLFCLLIPFFCAAKERVFIVSDVFKNVFTLNGADFLLEDDSLSIELGDHFVVKSEEKIPLPDNSYCLLSELTHVESGVTRNFTSTIMNDHDEAAVQEIVIESAEVKERKTQGFQGNYTYYIPELQFHIYLADGASYYVWNGSLKDERSYEKAQQNLEAFLTNLPQTVKICRDDCLQKGNQNKIHQTVIECPNGITFWGLGARRKRGKDIFDSQIDLCVAQRLPCTRCGENAWHIYLINFGALHPFSYLDHKLAHKIEPIPIIYRSDLTLINSLKLLRIYEDAQLGRIYVMQLLPQKKEIRLFVNKTISE